jgi:hypothetical protein
MRRPTRMWEVVAAHGAFEDLVTWVRTTMLPAEREKDPTFSAETYVSDDDRVCVIARGGRRTRAGGATVHLVTAGGATRAPCHQSGASLGFLPTRGLMAPWKARSASENAPNCSRTNLVSMITRICPRGRRLG